MARTAIGLVSAAFGVLFTLIGLINLFWGNDPFFGLFLIVLSLIYYPPIQRQIEQKTGFAVPGMAKIAIGVFVVWASLGVGELMEKIDLMLKSSGS